MFKNGRYKKVWNIMRNVDKNLKISYFLLTSLELFFRFKMMLIAIKAKMSKYITDIAIELMNISNSTLLMILSIFEI
jgi:hypothetical protein